MNKESINLAVIVRTNGRNKFFLRRALASIVSQAVLPKVVFVVNDGDDTQAVDALFAELKLPEAFLRHLPRDRQVFPAPSRSRALNRGIAAAATRWISFLDDDDTWDPRFLERVAGALSEIEAEPKWGGIVVQTTTIYENLVGDRFVEKKRMPFNSAFRTLDLAALAVESQFTNNALIIKRDVYDRVGTYREDLPVQEDWEFNVRAAARFEFRVIPEALVNYHLRSSNSSDGNSSVDELLAVAVRIRNEWLRADLAAGRIGLGQLALMSESRGLGRELSRWIRWRKRLMRLFGKHGI